MTAISLQQHANALDTRPHLTSLDHIGWLCHRIQALARLRSRRRRQHRRAMMTFHLDDRMLADIGVAHVHSFEWYRQMLPAMPPYLR